MKRVMIFIICMTLCLGNVFPSYANEEVQDEIMFSEDVSNENIKGNGEQDSTENEAVKDDVEFKQEEVNDEPFSDEEDINGEEDNIDDNEEEIEEILNFSYQVHSKNIGWQNPVGSGEIAGTSGRALQMEAVKIDVSNNLYQGGVEYRVHIKNVGWQEWKKQGEIAGTEGKGLQLEAIQIRLTGELAKYYTVVYQTHIADFGWMSEVNEGDYSGSEGMGKRIEALKVYIMPRSEEVELSGRGFVKDYDSNALRYSSHVQNEGNMPWVSSGLTSGTTGRGLRVEGMAMRMDDSGANVLKGTLEYRVHGQDYGWQSWKQEGEYAGTGGQRKRVEAVQIRLKGEAANYYNIYYRCHVQNIGWMGWASNGNAAGTTGWGLRVEAIQVKLVPKGMGVPGQTSDSYREGKQGWYYENGYHFYYRNNQKLSDVRGIIGSKSSYEICINKQMSCVTIYAQDASGVYNIPVVAFACSPGSGTPTGVFYTQNKYRWHQLYGAMGQWCTRITGHVLFHSPPYTRFDNHTLWPAEYNKLGTWASAGCVRLRSGDAKWIYDNCKLSTKVTIYNSSYPGPLGKPSYEKIPLWQTWDPTDPTV